MPSRFHDGAGRAELPRTLAIALGKFRKVQRREVRRILHYRRKNNTHKGEQ
jgi:hypothetical protein